MDSHKDMCTHALVHNYWNVHNTFD